MYGQTGAGKTYTMLGDYSTEIVKNRKNSQHRLKTPIRNRKKDPSLYSSVDRFTKSNKAAALSQSILQQKDARTHKRNISRHASQASCLASDPSDINFGPYNDDASVQRIDVKLDNSTEITTTEADLSGSSGDHHRSRTEIPRSDKGILIHGLSDLFEQIYALQAQDRTVILRCSYFEIYND